MKTEAKKLGFKAVAKVVAPSMSGCSKGSESQCGIGYKNG